MKALILAAGKGTRLKNLTLERPKPMVEVGDRPLLAYLIDWLRGYGIVEIAINLHHFPEAITGYFGDGSEYGVDIRYSYEEQLLGTAGAAKRLQEYLDEPFVLVYGDVFTNLELARLVDFHRLSTAQSGADPSLTLALYRVSNPTECGLVDLEPSGRITRFVEKPSADQVFTDLANAGMCVVEPAILEHIPAGRAVDFGHDLFPHLLERDIPIFGLPIRDDEFLIDIGTQAGLTRAHAAWTSMPHVDTFIAT
jgi:mannose-1-phosphate guanylyltransferase/phosphomannomutase